MSCCLTTYRVSLDNFAGAVPDGHDLLCLEGYHKDRTLVHHLTSRNLKKTMHSHRLTITALVLVLLLGVL